MNPAKWDEMRESIPTLEEKDLETQDRFCSPPKEKGEQRKEREKGENRLLPCLDAVEQWNGGRGPTRYILFLLVYVLFMLSP